MKLFHLVMILVLSAFVAFPAFAADECVPEKEAIAAWEDAVDRMEGPTSGLMTTNLGCNPCSCATAGEDAMALCYEYLAASERARAQKRKEVIEIFERAKKFGICR